MKLEATHHLTLKNMIMVESIGTVMLINESIKVIYQGNV